MGNRGGASSECLYHGHMGGILHRPDLQPFQIIRGSNGSHPVGKIPYPFLIGDAREVRNVMGSVWDAYEVARLI
jgi:hypothetical protein